MLACTATRETLPAAATGRSERGSDSAVLTVSGAPVGSQSGLYGEYGSVSRTAGVGPASRSGRRTRTTSATPGVTSRAPGTGPSAAPCRCDRDRGPWHRPDAAGWCPSAGPVRYQTDRRDGPRALDGAGCSATPGVAPQEWPIRLTRSWPKCRRTSSRSSRPRCRRCGPGQGARPHPRWSQRWW